MGYKSTGEWKEEIVFFDPQQSAAAEPDGECRRQRRHSRRCFPTALRRPGDRDPREVFADWLIAPKNPWFARDIVNRVWCWLLGRGIIHEPDDIRPDNPPSNPELLAYLERELVAAHYDLKQFIA